MATMLPSADRETLYPEITSAAFPSMSAPSFCQLAGPEPAAAPLIVRVPVAAESTLAMLCRLADAVSVGAAASTAMD